MMWNRYDEAYRNYKHLEEYYNTKKDEHYLPKVIFNIATILEQRGEPDNALTLYEKSFHIARGRELKAGKQMQEYSYDIEVGLYDDYKKTSALYNETLIHKLRLIGRLNIGSTAFFQANIYYEKGEVANALKWFNIAMREGGQHGDPIVKVTALAQLARILDDEEKFDEALSLYDENIT